MTTHRPTAEAGSLPNWLPDEATLGRLANEFFAAAPGVSAAPAVRGRSAAPARSDPISGPEPGDAVSDPTARQPDPTAPEPDPTASPSGARSVPAAPNADQAVSGAHGFPDDPFSYGLPKPGSAPDPATTLTAQAPDGPFADLAPGVPVGMVTPPAPVPSSPYYFLGESSAYRPGASSPGATGIGTGPIRPDYVAGVPALPDSLFGVGVPDLDVLVGAAQPTTMPERSAALAAPGNSFYFLDRPAAESLESRPAGDDPIAPDRHPAFDVHAVRRDFPILSERVNGRQLIWLDNAATTQKPQAVIDRLAYFYAHENSNIHRAAHELAARATDAYEGARAKVARFLHAGSADDIIFVRGATEAINLVAQAWGRAHIRRGDEIVISHLEHHANIVPWQMLAAESGALIKVIPVDDSGQLVMSEYARLLSDRTKIVSVTQVSNALGTVTPAQQIVDLGHRAGAKVLIDGAQSVPHLRVDLQSLGADFFVFSGHKIYGPTGIGVLYGRPEVLADMPPWQGGGNMIADVTLERAVYQNPPNRFEAGTGNIADAVGLGAALDYVDRIGLENIAAYEHQLLEYATPRMRQVPGLHLVGTAREKASVLSFVLDGYRTDEVGKALNEEGIAVRAGHHCAQPILRRFGLETTVRPSLAFYNTCEEIDTMVAALHRLSADRGRR